MENAAKGGGPYCMRIKGKAPAAMLNKPRIN
jgi:hypothetical protein